MAVACERPLPEAVLDLLEEHWEGPPTPVSGSLPGALPEEATSACRHAFREIQPVPAPRTLFPLRPRLKFPIGACFRLRGQDSPLPSAPDPTSQSRESQAASVPATDGPGAPLPQDERGAEGGLGGEDEGGVRNGEEGRPGEVASELGPANGALLELPLGNDLLTQIFLHLSPVRPAFPGLVPHGLGQ